MRCRRFLPGTAVLTMLGAVALLNLALGMHNIWPTPWVTSRFEFAVEAFAIVLALALLIQWRGSPGRGVQMIVGMLIVLLVLGRYADVTAPALYGRPVNLYWDARHLPGVLAMLARVASWWQLLLMAVAIMVATAIAVLGATRIVKVICTALVSRPVRKASMLVSTAVIALWTVASSADLQALSPWFSRPVTQSLVQHLARLGSSLTADSRQELHADPLSDDNIQGLDRASVLIMFIESYGATTFDRPAQAEALHETRQKLLEAASASGRQTLSAMVDSPTFGGGSWLAHSSFLSGHKVTNQGEYDQLLASSRASLVTRFNAQGYRTLALVPGIRLAWPEGSYYGFNDIYDAERLAYPGPDFGWWRIPDQFALAKLASQELQPPLRQPVMAFFTSITSHAPFRPVAPYIDDWSRLLGAAPYGAAADLPELIMRPDWTNLTPAYVESIDYALQTLTGFLSQADPSMLLVVLGDHQPATAVSGPQARWSVPVHIFARQQNILKKLTDAGFRPGIEPPSQAIEPMHKLANLILQALADRRDAQTSLTGSPAD